MITCTSCPFGRSAAGLCMLRYASAHMRSSMVHTPLRPAHICNLPYTERVLIIRASTDRYPVQALGMHPGLAQGPSAAHAHVAHSPPDRPEFRRPASIASSHISGAVLDCDNIADAWRNATEQLYELEQCRDGEGSVRSGRSFARTMSSHTGLPQSLTQEPQHSVIPLLEGSAAHTSPFHQPVPPLHHRPSTRSTTASHGGNAPTSSASLPQPSRGNLTTRTHNTDPQPSPRNRAPQRTGSSTTSYRAASMRPDSNSVSLVAPAALQYGHGVRVPSMAGSGYGATPAAGKAGFQTSIYAPSDHDSDDGVADDSAYNGGPHDGVYATPAVSAVGAATATTGDELNALATYTWTGSDTDGARSALNAAGAVRRALAGSPGSPRHRPGSAGHAALAVATGVHNVGSSTRWPTARVMMPQHGRCGTPPTAPLVGGKPASRAGVPSSGMHAVSAGDGRSGNLAPLPENHDSREARHETITKLQLFSAILFFAGMNDVAELETIVQEVRRADQSTARP